MTTQPISLQHSAGNAGHDSKTEPRARPYTGEASQLAGMLWFGGWLFTISFAKLVWWQAVLGLVVWPYFLGGAIR